MIELPEALVLAGQMNKALSGRVVEAVLPPSKPHKFCWFAGDPADYGKAVCGSAIASAEGFGIFAELSFDNGKKLCVNDGVNARLLRRCDAPKDYQLLIAFTDGDALVFTVAMYGGVVLHGGEYDNEYYQKSRTALSPFAPEYRAQYERQLAADKPALSAKAFLATGQRFPGVGNGVLQDILFNARMHPKRKLSTLDAADRDALYDSLVSTLRRMTDGGGRDTEKDLYGQPGGYKTLMSKNTLPSGCPVCGGPVVKEAYLGGSVYYCPHCQPL